MIVEEVFPVNEEFAILSYLVLPIILNAMTLLLPNKPDDININRKGINTVGLIILSIVFTNTNDINIRICELQKRTQ